MLLSPAFPLSCLLKQASMESRATILGKNQWGDIVVTGWKCQLAPNKTSCDIWEGANRNSELAGDPKLEPALSFPCLYVAHFLFMDFFIQWEPGAEH